MVSPVVFDKEITLPPLLLAPVTVAFGVPPKFILAVNVIDDPLQIVSVTGFDVIVNVAVIGVTVSVAKPDVSEGAHGDDT